MLDPETRVGDTIEVRLLPPHETGVLDRVADQVFDDAIDPVRAAEFLRDPRHHLAVAVDADVVVGFASAVHYVHPDKPHPELWINEIGVAPSHQRRGLGARLMQALLAEGRRLGCGEAWVATERSNRAAVGLYTSLGGRPSQDPPVVFDFPLGPTR